MAAENNNDNKKSIVISKVGERRRTQRDAVNKQQTTLDNNQAATVSTTMISLYLGRWVNPPRVYYGVTTTTAELEHNGTVQGNPGGGCNSAVQPDCRNIV